MIANKSANSLNMISHRIISSALAQVKMKAVFPARREDKHNFGYILGNLSPILAILVSFQTPKPA